MDDALQAGLRLLAHGPVRVKLATGIAGLGQFVVDSSHALATALDRIDPGAMSEAGVVVEENLTDVTTHSVGQFRVADPSARTTARSSSPPIIMAHPSMAARICASCGGTSTHCCA